MNAKDGIFPNLKYLESYIDIRIEITGYPVKKYPLSNINTIGVHTKKGVLFFTGNPAYDSWYSNLVTTSRAAP